MNISDIIRSERKERRMSMREFGAAFGVSYTLVDMWERGKSKPDFYMLYYLYHHVARGWWVIDFCDKLMRVLRPDLWPEQPQFTGFQPVTHHPAGGEQGQV